MSTSLVAENLSAIRRVFKENTTNVNASYSQQVLNAVIAMADDEREWLQKSGEAYVEAWLARIMFEDFPDVTVSRHSLTNFKRVCLPKDNVVAISQAILRRSGHDPATPVVVGLNDSDLFYLAAGYMFSGDAENAKGWVLACFKPAIDAVAALLLPVASSAIPRISEAMDHPLLHDLWDAILSSPDINDGDFAPFGDSPATNVPVSIWDISASDVHDTSDHELENVAPAGASSSSTLATDFMPKSGAVEKLGNHTLDPL